MDWRGWGAGWAIALTGSWKRRTTGRSLGNGVVEDHPPRTRSHRGRLCNSQAGRIRPMSRGGGREVPVGVSKPSHVVSRLPMPPPPTSSEGTGRQTWVKAPLPPSAERTGRRKTPFACPAGTGLLPLRPSSADRRLSSGVPVPLSLPPPIPRPMDVGPCPVPAAAGSPPERCVTPSRPASDYAAGDILGGEGRRQR